MAEKNYDADRANLLKIFIHKLMDHFTEYFHRPAQMQGATHPKRLLPQTLEEFANVLIPILNEMLSAQHQALQEHQRRNLQYLLECLTQLQSHLPSQQYYLDYYQYKNQVVSPTGKNAQSHINQEIYTRAITKDGEKIGTYTVKETTDKTNNHKHFEISKVSNVLNNDEKAEMLAHFKSDTEEVGKKYGYTTSVTVSAAVVGGLEEEQLSLEEASSILSKQQKESQLQRDDEQEKQSPDHDEDKVRSTTPRPSPSNKKEQLEVEPIENVRTEKNVQTEVVTSNSSFVTTAHRGVTDDFSIGTENYNDEHKGPGPVNPETTNARTTPRFRPRG